MATAQTATAQNPPAPRSAFGSAFDAFLGVGANIATDILRSKGEEYLARENAQTQVDVQAPYNQLARQSSNLGPNEVAPAQRQAVEQAKLITGIDFNSPGIKQMFFFGIAAIVGAIVIYKVLKK